MKSLIDYEAHRLDDRAAHARSRVDSEFKLALLAVVSREAFQEESSETRARTTTERVEDEEACAHFRQHYKM